MPRYLLYLSCQLWLLLRRNIKSSHSKGGFADPSGGQSRSKSRSMYENTEPSVFFKGPRWMVLRLLQVDQTLQLRHPWWVADTPDLIWRRWQLSLFVSTSILLSIWSGCTGCATRIQYARTIHCGSDNGCARMGPRRKNPAERDGWVREQESGSSRLG